MWHKGLRWYHVESDILREGPGTKTFCVRNVQPSYNLMGGMERLYANYLRKSKFHYLIIVTSQCDITVWRQSQRCRDVTVWPQSQRSRFIFKSNWHIFTIALNRFEIWILNFTYICSLGLWPRLSTIVRMTLPLQVMLLCYSNICFT